MNDRARGLGPTCLVLLAIGTARSADEPAKIPDVTVARPVTREVTDYEDFTGRTDASVSVNLRPRVTGYVTKTSFKEGTQVKEGDVLFEIDPRPHQTQLDLALSQVTLGKASLKVARTTLARDQAAVKAAPGSVSQQQLDRDEAAVEEAQAQIAVAEATTALHKLNLSFCKVTAPVSGRISRSFAAPGNLVQRDQTLLSVIVVPSPMFVFFDVDERTFARLPRGANGGAVELGKLPVAVGLADEGGFSRDGVLDFINHVVNPSTGTIAVRTTLANKDGALVPGQFVRVRLALSPPRKALVISDRAVASDQGLKYVYVLDAENKVRYRPVTTGPLQPDGLRVITKGLTPDDRVVLGKLTELRPGTTVRPQEATPPAPKPPEKNETPPSVNGRAGPGVFVEATCARAGAQVVSELVRAPIEQQVTGLEKIRYMRSRCTKDGEYALDVAFAPRTDLRLAQTLVQNRVSLAIPVLPALVRGTDITVRRGTAGVLLVVNLFSSDGKCDRAYLSNYASIHFKKQLAREEGVGEVAVLGSGGSVLCVALDPDRLTNYSLSTEDVARVLRKENEQKEADLEELKNLIVKDNEPGRGVRLRDVARVDYSPARSQGGALRDGTPVAALVVYQTGDVAPREVRAALQKRLNELRTQLPEGLDFDVTFDFTANQDALDKASPEYLLFDLDVTAAFTEGTEPLLERSEALLHRVPGVQSVLAMSANPFDPFGGRPCLLARLGPAEPRKASREDIIKTARLRLGAIEGATVRVRDLSVAGRFPRCGYPIDLALHGPDQAEVRKWADRLADRLGRSKMFTDVWANPDSVPRPTRVLEINRELAAARGVLLADISSTIDAYAGAVSVNRFYGSGQTRSVEIQMFTQTDDSDTGLGKLKVRNAKGEMVPLASVVTVRGDEAPDALDFLDGRPMVGITASPEAGTSVGAAQKACVALAAEVRKELGLTAEYRLTWLPGGESGK